MILDAFFPLISNPSGARRYMLRKISYSRKFKMAATKCKAITEAEGSMANLINKYAFMAVSTCIFPADFKSAGSQTLYVEEN